MVKSIYILGFMDEEMRHIEALLQSLGIQTTRARYRGGNLSRETAYQATEAYMPVGMTPRIVTVECRVRGIRPDKAIDHHHPGDAGYDMPAERFWEGSSIGQVVIDLFEQGLPKTAIPGDIMRLLRYIAAGDHCLGAAYQGRCPGIDPEILRRVRAQNVARNTGSSIEQILASQERTLKIIEKAPLLDLGAGVLVKDLRGANRLAYIQDAACIAGEYPVLSGTPRKTTILNANPETIEAFRKWASREGMTGFYGSPERGYAGATK